MHPGNHWGGTLEINAAPDSTPEDERSRQLADWDRASISARRYDHDHDHHQLDETQQSWLLGPQEKKKKKYVDLGCVIVSQKALKYSALAIFVAFLVIGLPIIIAKTLPKKSKPPPPVDDYTVALRKALLFFDAQKSGKLPKNKRISWRRDSGLNDGNDTTDVKGGLVGGYYDAGDNSKFHFPTAFAMSMLSWSVIEYEHKYSEIGELDHVLDLIKWGTDYLLKTFNSSATIIDKIHSQVGGSQNGSKVPDDHYCWTRPEDMDYPRKTQTAYQASDLGAEMAAALAAASIVFRDSNEAYSKKLVKGAETVWTFARDSGKRRSYSRGNLFIEPFYNSTQYWDEYMWGSTWMFYATGNSTYLALATTTSLARNAGAPLMIPDLSVLSWDNKLPAAMLLLTRLRLFLGPGYPYEDMLRSYHNFTSLTMCSYLQRFGVFNWTRGGLIQLNHGQGQPLQYVANAAFLANLFVDYMDATDIPGWSCGPHFIEASKLRDFATSQIDYILGANPMNMSYVVGHGNKFPRQVHHRGASIPNDRRRYSCTGGWKFRDSSRPNPLNITGAMVGGPDRFDRFQDNRKNYSQSEPTIAGNAGLVAALVSLTSSGGHGVDKNTIFASVPPLYPMSPPPPPPWKPVN